MEHRQQIERLECGCKIMTSRDRVGFWLVWISRHEDDTRCSKRHTMLKSMFRAWMDKKNVGHEL